MRISTYGNQCKTMKINPKTIQNAILALFANCDRQHRSACIWGAGNVLLDGSERSWPALMPLSLRLNDLFVTKTTLTYRCAQWAGQEERGLTQ